MTIFHGDGFYKQTYQFSMIMEFIWMVSLLYLLCGRGMCSCSLEKISHLQSRWKLVLCAKIVCYFLSGHISDNSLCKYKSLNTSQSESVLENKDELSVIAYLSNYSFSFLLLYLCFTVQLLSCKIFMKIVIVLYSDILNTGFLNFKICCG